MSRWPPAAFISFLTFSIFALDPHPRIIETFGEFDGYPEWVSSAVGVRNGALNAELLRPSAVERLTKLARRNPPAQPGVHAECRAFSTWTTEHHEKRNTVDDLVRNAKYLVSGRVLAVQDGFLRGFAGRLLRVSGPLLKGPASPHVYLFYPAATIQTAEGAICARPVGDYVQPQVGDRIMAFAIAGGRTNGEISILEADPTHEVVHESATGKLRLPNVLRRADSSLTFDELDARVRRQTAISREPDKCR